MAKKINDSSKTKHAGGRPVIPINADLVHKLASIHCTMEEISDVVGCSVDTLERRFAEIIKRGKSQGKSSLRRMQWKIAEDGNCSMCIFLGKVILKQKEDDGATQEQLAKLSSFAEEIALMRSVSPPAERNARIDAKELPISP